MDFNTAALLYLVSGMMLGLLLPAVIFVLACYNEETGTYRMLKFKEAWPLQVVCVPYYYMIVQMLLDVNTIVRSLSFG